MVIDVMVGLVKNPLQLTANARVASAANAPTRRNLFFVLDIETNNSFNPCAGDLSFQRGHGTPRSACLVTELGTSLTMALN